MVGLRRCARGFAALCQGVCGAVLGGNAKRCESHWKVTESNRKVTESSDFNRKVTKKIYFKVKRK